MKKLILKSQKNGVFNIMSILGLEPSMFEWLIVKSKFSNDQVSMVRHINSDHYFIFDFLEQKYFCSYSPGRNKPVVEAVPGTWEYLFDQYLPDWLRTVKQEIEIVDPWEEIEKYLPGSTVNLENESGNAQFTYDQVVHITEAVEKLKKEIANNFHLKGLEEKLVQQKLDYLIDRSKKLGKIDWKNLFLGTLMGLAANLAFNPEQAKTLWTLVRICFKGIVLLGNG